MLIITVVSIHTHTSSFNFCSTSFAFLVGGKEYVVGPETNAGITFDEPLVIDPGCGVNSEHSILHLQRWMREAVDG